MELIFRGSPCKAIWIADDVHILIDSDGTTRISRNAGNTAAPHQQLDQIESIAYRLKRNANALIIVGRT